MSLVDFKGRYDPYIGIPSHDSASGLMRTVGRTYSRDATNKQDADMPRDKGQIANTLQDNPSDTNHLGSTKVLVATYEPGDYVLIGSTGGTVSLYKYEKANNALDPGATNGTGGKSTTSTGDSIASINAKATWRRGEKYNNGARQIFIAK
jgi:hypothetical protein